MSKKVADNVAVLDLEGRSGSIHPVLLWDEKHVVLIDTGFPMQFDLFRRELMELGLVPEQITHILFTHQDIDHIGCAKEFISASPNIETVAHVDETPYINGEKIPLKLDAMEANLENLTLEMRGFHDMLKQGFENRKIQIHRKVEDGDILPLCGGIQVVLTAGHTIGHVCYYLMKSKVLVGGDAFNSVNGELHGPSPMYSYDYEQAKASLRRLLDYDMSTMVAYHGGIIEGEFRDRIRAL